METATDAARLPGEGSPFWIQYPLDIRQQFRLLCKHGERVRLWYNPADSIVSVILEINDEGELILDVGPDARVNQRLLQAPQIIFFSNLEGVDLKCALGPLRSVTHQGLPAFATPLPRRLHRLQRRESHRVPIPVGLAVRCEVPRDPPRSDGRPAASGRQPVKMIDLSLGGLAFEEPAGSGMDLSPGAHLPDCRIQLDDMGVIQADLQVRYTCDILSRSGVGRRKVGCKFIRLSTGGEQLIQRFINRIELDRKTPGAA